jgi:hypothetical protein
MKSIALPQMLIISVLLPQVATRHTPVTTLAKAGRTFRASLTLAQDAGKKKDAEKDIPKVVHNKKKGKGYAEGSHLYDKQQAKATVKSGKTVKKAEATATATAIEEGRNKVSIVFCIIFVIFLLLVYAMFQVQVRGKDVNPNFTAAVQLTIRTAVFAFFLSCLVWFPSLHWVTPADFQDKVPLVICLYFFTVNPILGTTIQNAFAGALGTLWAFLMIWFMNGVFPGGMAPGMSMASAPAIFGWVSFFFFTFIILWSKCGIGMKMFALANAIGGMLAFMNPDSTVRFSEGFKIDPRGTMFSTLIATLIACAISPVVNLFPSVLTSAFLSMSGKATSASKTTASLFEDVVEYYGGSAASVRIELHIKHAVDMRATIDGMSGTIAAAWWECFDAGKYGRIRALMEAHQTMMSDLHDRLCASLVAASTEQFEPSHVRVMQSIMERSREVARLTGQLLVDVTECAADGHIDGGEREKLIRQVNIVKDSVRALAREFDATRRSLRTPINVELLGESFFVLTLSAYARLVCEYTDMLLRGPPQAPGFGADVMAGIRSTWSGLLDKDNMFFLLKHFVAFSVCWIYAIYFDSFSGSCVITAVFLMNNLSCPDVQALLNAMNAVILSAVVGSLVFEWSCESQHSIYVLPFLTLAIWLFGLFGVFSGSRFATASIFIVALIPFKLIAHCPPPGSDLVSGAAGTYHSMVGFVLAIIFVALFQYMLAKDRASNLALQSLQSAFTDLKDGLAAFWVAEDMTKPLSTVAGYLATGAACSASAAIEPRLWRTQWNHPLYLDVVASLKVLRLDFMMMWHAIGGRTGSPEKLFNRFSATPEFKAIQMDLSQTFSDAAMICTNMLAHTGGVLSGLQELKTTTGIDELEALGPLINNLNRSLNFPAVPGETMEDDDLCQISTILLMLDSTVKHVAHLLKKPVKNI